MVQDKEALQQQVALLKLASQDDMAALQKQLANVIAERDVGHEQIKAAEQQAAAETAHRVRVEGSAHDVQQQLSRQTAEAGKAQQACKKLHEQVGQAHVTGKCSRLLTDSHGKQAHTACCSFTLSGFWSINSTAVTSALPRLIVTPSPALCSKQPVNPFIHLAV